MFVFISKNKKRQEQTSNNVFKTIRLDKAYEDEDVLDPTKEAR